MLTQYPIPQTDACNVMQVATENHQCVANARQIPLNELRHVDPNSQSGPPVRNANSTLQTTQHILFEILQPFKKHGNIFLGSSNWPKSINLSRRGQKSALNHGNCKPNSQAVNSSEELFDDDSSRQDTCSVQSVQNLSFTYDSDNEWFDQDCTQFQKQLMETQID